MEITKMKKEIKLLNTEIRYFADDEGEIYRLDEDGQFIKLKQQTLNSGYKAVYIRGYSSMTLVHRCVYNAFIDNAFNVRSENRAIVIDHKDGNRINNKPDNLQILSASENIKKSLLCDETEIVITNVDTNEKYCFNSYRKAAKAMKLIDPRINWNVATLYTAAKNGTFMCKKTYKIEAKKKKDTSRNTSRKTKYRLVDEKGNVLKVYNRIVDILEQCDLDNDIKSQYLLKIRINLNAYVNHKKKTKIIKDN